MTMWTAFRSVCALALLCVPSMASGQAGTVLGVLVDSLDLEGARPGEPFRRIAGATISLGAAGQRATTDSLGRFTFRDLPPGPYRVAYWDPWLERVGLPPLGGEFEVRGDSAIGVVLATPSIGTYQRLQCDAELPDGQGVLLGDVRGSDGEPLQGVSVSAHWTEVRLGGAELQRSMQERRSTTRASGGYVLCGVARGGEIDLRVVRDADDATSVVFAMDAPVDRRDLILGTAARAIRVSGSVADSLDRVVIGAVISAEGDSAILARTDESGRFAFTLDRPRSRQILVRAIGHAPARADVEPVGTEIDLGRVSLRPLVVGLDTVRVAGQRDPFDWRADFDRRRRAGVGGFITEEQIKRLPRVTPNAIATIARRIRVNRDTIFLLRGVVRCQPRWFVDGNDEGTQVQNGRGWVETILDRAKSIEVYSAAQAPPKFNDFDGCGAIVVWTR